MYRKILSFKLNVGLWTMDNGQLKNKVSVTLSNVQRPKSGIFFLLLFTAVTLSAQDKRAELEVKRQKILFGQPVFLTDKKNLKPVYNASLQTLTLSGSNAKHNAVYNFDTSDFQLKDMTIEEPAASRSINIINGNADVLGDKKFAYLRTININSPQTGKAVIVIDVDNKSVEIDVPKNIKF